MKEEPFCKLTVKGKNYTFTVHPLDKVTETDGGIYLYTTTFTRHSYDLFPFYVNVANNLRQDTLLIRQPEETQEKIKEQLSAYRVCILVIKDETERKSLYDNILQEEKDRKMQK